MNTLNPFSGGDQTDELFAARLLGKRSKFFGNRNLLIYHEDVVESAMFGEAICASILMIDGLALVLAGGVTEAFQSIKTNGNGDKTTYTRCSVNFDAQELTYSSDDYKVPTGMLPFFSTILYRTPERKTVFHSSLSAPIAENADAAKCEPSLFPLLLTEAIADVFTLQEKAPISSKGITQAWSDFLRIYNYSSSDKQLSEAVILMADWARHALLFRQRWDLIRGTRNDTFEVTHRYSTNPGKTDVKSPNFADKLADRYFVKGATEMFNTKQAAPRALAVAA